jgi:hypothetical protein
MGSIPISCTKNNRRVVKWLKTTGFEPVIYRWFESSRACHWFYIVLVFQGRPLDLQSRETGALPVHDTINFVVFNVAVFQH